MKLALLITSSLFLSLVSCSSSNKMTPNLEKADKGVSKVERAKPSKNHQLSIRFKNERGEVVMQLDPDAEDLYLEFHGGQVPAKEEVSPIEKKSLEAEKQESKEKQAAQNENFLNALDSVFAGKVRKSDSLSREGLSNLDGIAPEDAQSIVALLGDAQTAFYAKDFEKAQNLLDESLRIVPTARAYAMLGSLGLVQGNRLAAREYWKKSLELDDTQVNVKKALSNLETKQ